jgi:transposase
MWLGHDLLAATARLGSGRGVGENSLRVAPAVGGRGRNRLVAGRCGQHLGAGGFWGAQTGPNPTDRRKAGSKHHVLTDANGIPLATKLTGANAHDVTQLIPLVDAIPRIRGKRGRRRRPKRVQGDRAYDSEPHRTRLRRRGIRPVLAKRNTEHGSGLGVFRWVVERTNSWLHQFRRLRVRFEKRPDIHEAFLTLGCILICCRFL